MAEIYRSGRPHIPAETSREVKVESGHRCAINKCLEHTYLEIHHIDENRENNSLENLILLCDKHHKMAHARIIDRRSLYKYKKNTPENSAHIEPDRFNQPNQNIRIVDIYEIDSSSQEDFEEATTIEIKLRNCGNEVAFLKEIRISTLEHWETITDRHHSLVDVSAQYHLVISEKANSIARAKIHHQIKPQEVERIRFRLGTDFFSDPDGLSLFF